MTVLSTAIAYTQASLRVLPLHSIGCNGGCTCGDPSCSSPGKHPRTKHGHLNATCDAERVVAWWNAMPDANLGVVTGCGLLILDIDPRHGGDKSLRDLVEQHGPLPPTPQVSTGGGGEHYYFRTNQEIRCRTGIRPGIDVKGEGGFVVAPPSRHASGRPYEWKAGRNFSEIPLTGAPAWLVELATSRAKNAPIDETAPVREGGRNSYLTSCAGRWRREGKSESEILGRLRAENERQCIPPLPEQELAGIAASISKYPATLSIPDVLNTSGLSTLKADSPIEERQTVLGRLATLSRMLDPVQRELLREEATKRLQEAGFKSPARVLTAVFKKEAPVAADPLQGKAILFPEVAPWSQPVETASLLDELHDTLIRFVILPSHAGVAVALWILHSYVLDAAQISPRLAVLSPAKRCGKSTLLKLLQALVRRGLSVANLTASVLYRVVETYHPTLLVDEADTFLRDHEELRGVLNAGHDRSSATIARCDGDDHEPRLFDAWGAVAIAAIGKLPDTLMDRSIVIRLTPAYLAKRLRSYGVKSSTIRIGNETAKGYMRADFEDAFERYLDPRTVTDVTSSKSLLNLSEFEASHESVVTAPNGAKSTNDFAHVTDVTALNGGRACAPHFRALTQTITRRTVDESQRAY